MRSLASFIIATLLIFSCRKESFTNSSDAFLQTSVDTLHFDTVFTTTGSITQFVKIINTNSKGVRISSVELKGGVSSPFKINVDGLPGPIVNSIDIEGNDSTYMFVTVSINPATTNLPFVVRDSVEINYNGNKQVIQLEAYGQNAHFFRNRNINANEIWNNDLPYVILGALTVNEDAELTINKGCRIYVHADAPIIINGTLNVLGEQYDSTKVVFTGDRLDDPYRDFPASWPGILFTNTSSNNLIKYGIIKNAYQAVVVTEPVVNANPKLTLSETIIDNAYDIGLIGVNSSITARNLLVSNCGKNIMLVKGGNYQFTHCTVASISNNYVQHKDPVLLVSNFLKENNVVISRDLSVTFTNCIFWDEGSTKKNEIEFAKNSGATFEVTFDHVLWKMETPPSNDLARIIGTPINDSPQFDSINTQSRYYSFRLKDDSPAVNKGLNTIVNIDLDGNSRPKPAGKLPDLGAYENQQQ
ncbi:MAG: hypothetical protein ICV66_04620 [Chitinophagaceae bacterium]|nr:hypothetical protein [Chitinophagaceae bacterium]